MTRGERSILTRGERSILIASLGLALTIAGAFLPWATIGGRSRSGFSTADTFIALARPLPDAIAWIGRWWYLPAVLAVIAWATTFARGTRLVRAAGVLALVLGAGMWWLFVWAGGHYNVLDTRWTGPAVATSGIAVIGFACLQPRESLLRPSTPAPDR